VSPLETLIAPRGTDGSSPASSSGESSAVGNFCFRPQSRPGERRAVGAGHAGISGRNLLSLLLKFVSVEGCPQMLQTLMVPPVAQSGSANTRLGPAIFGQCPSGRCSVPVIKVTIASVIGSQPSSLLYFGNASR
jgi:hypothetical protein